METLVMNPDNAVLTGRNIIYKVNTIVLILTDDFSFKEESVPVKLICYA